MYGGVAVMLVVTVVAIAYGTAAPQFGVAEFAPAARSQVDAPPTTSGATGSASGSRGRRSSTTTAPSTATTGTDPGQSTAGPATTRVGRARRCYGNPPRQSEDPLSPACLPTIFEGTNGGDTSRGVTATEIRVAVPIQLEFGGATDALMKAVVTALFEHFNSQFEFYGRRLVPVFMTGNGVDSGDAVKARAVAQQIAAQSVFAALTGTLEPFGSSPQPALANALAANKIVTVVQNKSTWWSDRFIFDELHPFLWSLYPSAERLEAQIGSVACSLASGPARDPNGAVVASARKFGIISIGMQIAPRTDGISNAIEGCTGSRPERVEATSAAGTASSGALRTAMERFAASGVTTVICACESTWSSGPISGAVAANKNFEFLYPQSADYDGDEWLGGANFQYSGLGRNPLYAVTPGKRLEPPQAAAWFPIVAGNPAFVGTDGDRGSNLAYTFRIADVLYPQLLVLASGVQAAGPALVPDTFAVGLQSGVFPNSEANRAPSWLPSVGFGPGDHGFFDDFSLARWDSTIPTVTPTHAAQVLVGSWCYVGGGERYRPEAMPSDLEARLFGAGPCR